MIAPTITRNGATYCYLRTDEGFAIERIYVNVDDANDMLVIPCGLSVTYGN